MIWDHFQNEGSDTLAGSRARLHHMARIGAGLVAREDGRAPRVLNIGLGRGFFEEEALARGLEVYSLDPSERAIEAARSRLSLGERARVGFSQDIPFEDAAFDAVCMSEVLEHLSPEVFTATLDEVSRVLRPGGFFFGTVPAREDLAVNMVVCPKCTEHFHRWGHTRSFDRESLLAALRTRFEVDGIEERPFPCWETLNVFGRIQAVSKKLLGLLGRHGSGESLVFKARRRA